MNNSTVLGLVILSGLLAALYGWVQSRSIAAQSAGNDRMKEIAAAIQEGAKAYLNRQYTTIGWVGAGVTVLLAIAFRNWEVPVGFLIGAVLSGAAGFIGMNVSVQAKVRLCPRSSTISTNRSRDGNVGGMSSSMWITAAVRGDVSSSITAPGCESSTHT